MARGKAHDPELRAAVMAALLSGQGVTEVAQQHRLDTGLVSRWKKQIPAERLQELAVEKGIQLENLLFDYLTTNLKSLKSQAEVAGDPTYLKKFPPQQLAVLHGVMADKAVRLLEAAAAANEQPDQPAPEPTGGDDPGEDEEAA